MNDLMKTALMLAALALPAAVVAAVDKKGAKAPDKEAVEKKEIPAPADVAAVPADAVTSPTGLASKVLQTGTGTEHPVPYGSRSASN